MSGPLLPKPQHFGTLATFTISLHSFYNRNSTFSHARGWHPTSEQYSDNINNNPRTQILKIHITRILQRQIPKSLQSCNIITRNTPRPHSTLPRNREYHETLKDPFAPAEHQFRLGASPSAIRITSWREADSVGPSSRAAGPAALPPPWHFHCAPLQGSIRVSFLCQSERPRTIDAATHCVIRNECNDAGPPGPGVIVSRQVRARSGGIKRRSRTTGGRCASRSNNRGPRYHGRVSRYTVIEE